MRDFNTSGPCNPAQHYTVLRELLVAKGKTLVEKGRYFTIFAPRQSGKTTYFQLLFRQLPPEEYLPIWITFEGLRTLSRSEFYETLKRYLQDEFSTHGIQVNGVIKNPVNFQHFISNVSEADAMNPARKIVIVIDEFEDIPKAVMSEVMHIFRAMYQKREHHNLHSLILVGVSSLAELVVSSASPFNVVDELQISYFTRQEAHSLIEQYVAEWGQPFDEAVFQAIYDNTVGQPGLFCALCQYLVEVKVTDRSQPITMDAFYPTLRYFLTERFDKNILNIVQKAREKQDFMLEVLFGETPIPFTVDNPDIAFLYANGVIDVVDGMIQISVPLYAKRLITAFRPRANGEVRHIVSYQDTFSGYATSTGLNLQAILNQYRNYVRRRGFRAFDTEHLGSSKRKVQTDV